MTALVKGNWKIIADPGIVQQGSDVSPGGGSKALEIPFSPGNEAFQMFLNMPGAERLEGSIQWFQKAVRVGSQVSCGPVAKRNAGLAQINAGIELHTGEHLSGGGSVRSSLRVSSEDFLNQLQHVYPSPGDWNKFRATLHDSGSTVQIALHVLDGANWNLIFWADLTELNSPLATMIHMWGFDAFGIPGTVGDIIRLDQISMTEDAITASPLPAASTFVEGFEDSSWERDIRIAKLMPASITSAIVAGNRPGSAGSNKLQTTFLGLPSLVDAWTLPVVGGKDFSARIYFRIDQPAGFLSQAFVRLFLRRRDGINHTDGYAGHFKVTNPTNISFQVLRNGLALNTIGIGTAHIPGNWYWLRLTVTGGDGIPNVKLEWEDVTLGSGISVVHNAADPGGDPILSGVNALGMSGFQIGQRGGTVDVDDFAVTRI